MPPLTEAGFKDTDGRPHVPTLIQTGPTLQVIVLPASAETAPKLSDQVSAWPALIDTGASESCIDNELAKSLGLTQIDVIAISGVGGMQNHPVYLCSILIPSLNIAQYGRFAGVNLAVGGQTHRVLLGRTFLNGTIMIYDGIRGQVTLASPSIILPPPSISLAQ